MEEEPWKEPLTRKKLLFNMEDESTIESRASNSPITPSMSNPGTPRSDVASEVNATAPPQPGQQQHRQQHQLQQQQQQLLQQQMQQQLLQQQQSQSKYSQLLAVIEDMGRDIRPTYSGSRTSAERLKRGIVHARILVRECLMECERSARA